MRPCTYSLVNCHVAACGCHSLDLRSASINPFQVDAPPATNKLKDDKYIFDGSDDAFENDPSGLLHFYHGMDAFRVAEAHFK
jgi:hypothetical protein